MGTCVTRGCSAAVPGLATRARHKTDLTNINDTCIDDFHSTATLDGFCTGCDVSVY